MAGLSAAGEAFLAARDFLLRHRADHRTAVRNFRWPAVGHFNWALDYFDGIAAGNDKAALQIVEENGAERLYSFARMAARSNQLANFLRELGVRRGDRMLLMLGNEVALWETVLAAMKLGAVVSPASGLLTPDDLQDRVDRGAIGHVIAAATQAAKFDNVRGSFTRTVVDADIAGWEPYARADAASATFEPDGEARAIDPLLLYFTSGTTARPKMVLHTHQSYPIGHLSTLFFAGVQPGDRHWNISSPGWAKHAWSSFFVPWSASRICSITSGFSGSPALSALVVVDEHRRFGTSVTDTARRRPRLLWATPLDCRSNQGRWASLPKTVSGKIRRVELRAIEEERRASGARAPLEFFEQDFSSL